jgi:hypothetical protein
VDFATYFRNNITGRRDVTASAPPPVVLQRSATSSQWL